MTSYIKQDDPDGTTVTRRGTGARKRFPEQPPTSAANDKDCEGSWPLVPFPKTACPSLLYEEVITPRVVQASFRSSWRATLGRLAYLAVVSIAMFGWLYLLWLAPVSSVQGILS
jgi:hypothetical protein